MGPPVSDPGDRIITLSDGVADEAATFERDYADAVAHLGLDEADRDQFRGTWGWMAQLGQGSYTLSDVVSMIQMSNRFGSEQPRRSTPPASPTVPPPPTLSDEARALYRKVEDLSFAEKIDWFTALAKVTGNAEYAPPRPVARPLEQATAEAQEEDRLAREVMVSHAIGYVDAVGLVRHKRELAEAKKGPEPSDVPWLDTRPLSAPPRPWSDEDWERDSRRAAAAEIGLTFEEWKAASELGRDLVGEQAEKARAEHVAELEKWGERFVRGAQETEAKLRAEAVEEELDRRAKTRLKEAESRVRGEHAG